jgi:fibronectin-binding autotransporter adhesin
MRSGSSKRKAVLSAAVMAVGFGTVAIHPRTAMAADKYTWVVGGTDTNWGTTNNWTGGTEHAYPQANDAYAQFTGALTGSQAAVINVTNANAYFTLFAGTASYTISSSNNTTDVLGLESFSSGSNDLGYGAGVTAIQVMGSGANTISAPIVINSGNTGTTGFTIDNQNTAANSLIISGNINGNASGGALPMTVEASSAGTVASTTVISGNISNVSTLTVNDSGTNPAGLYLTGFDTFSAVNITHGNLWIGKNTATGSIGTGTVTITNSAVLQFERSDANLVFSNLITGTSGQVAQNSGLVYLTNPSNSYTGTTYCSGGTLNFVAGALGSGAIDFYNSGILQFATGNTTDISARTFVFETGASAGIDTGSNTINFAHAIGGSGTGSLVKYGVGTLNLNAVDTYTGATTVDAGTLNINAAESYSGATTINAGTLNLGASGTLTSTALVLASGTFSTAATTAGKTFSTTTLSAGGSAVSPGFTNGNTLALGAITRNVGSDVNFTLPSSGSITTSTANANPTGGQQTILGGYATVAGTSWAVSGSGATAGAISSLSSYDTTLTPGTNEDAQTGTTTTPTTLTLNSLRFNNTGSYTFGNNSGDTLTIATGGILETSGVGNNPVTIQSATLTTPSGQDLIINQYNTAAPLTINSVIGPAGRGVTTSGSGTVVLGATNTFDGGLYIDGGQINYGTDLNLGAAGKPVNINSGGTLSFTGSTAYVDTRVFTVGFGGGTINIPVAGGLGGKITVQTTNNLIVANGPLTKTGPGWLSVYSTAGGSGAWNINGGVVEATATIGGGNAPITVNGNGTTNASNSGELSPDGNFALNNPVTLAGGILSADGQTNNVANFTGNINVTQNSTIRLGNFWNTANSNVAITGNLSGSGNLTLVNGLSGIPSGQTLTLGNVAGGGTNITNDTGYTGTITLPAGMGIAVNANCLVAVNVQASTLSAEPIIGLNYDPAGAITIPSNFTVPTGTTGVIALGTKSSSGSDSVNLSTLGGGGWYFGGDTSAESYFGTITPGSLNGVPTYRLGGGGLPVGSYAVSSLFVGNAVITNSGSVTNNVLVGDTRVGGSGEVRYGAQMTYTGTTTINAGSQLDMDFLNASSATNLIPYSPTQGGLIMNGGLFTLTGKANTTNSQQINGLTLNAGAASIQNNANATSNPQLLTLGSITRNVGGTVDFNSPTGTQSISNGIVTSVSQSDGIIGGWATYNGNSWATNGPGYVASYGAGGSFGSFTASIAGTTAPGTTANVDFQASNSTAWNTQAVNTIRFGTGASTLTIAGSNVLTITAGGIIEASGVGNNPTVITGGTLQGAAGADLVVNQFNTNGNGTLAINSVIADNTSATALTKSGNGTLILGAANTYTGNTYLNAGTIALTNGSALQDSTVVFTALQGNISFGSLTVASIGGLSGNQYLPLVNATPAAVALTIGNSNTNPGSQTNITLSPTYSGIMSGLGSLTKAGTNTQTLSGTNTYAGSTTVNAGALLITGALTGTGAVTVNGGGTLGGTGTIAGAVSVVGGTSSATQGSLSLIANGLPSPNVSTLTLQNGLTLDSANSGNPASLGFDINTTSSDKINLTGGQFTVNSGGATININSLVLASSLVNGTTYTLMSFPSGTGAGFMTGSGGLSEGALSLNPTISFGVTGTLTVTNTALQLTINAASAPANAFWLGTVGPTPSTWTSYSGSNGNFSTDITGATPVNAYPSQSTNVYFAENGTTPQNLNNTLGANFDIGSLTFLSSNTGATSIGGTASGANTLTVENGGITVQNGAGAVSINTTNLVLGTALGPNQTWTNSSSNTTSISSAISGGANLTLAGNFSLTGALSNSGSTTVSSGTTQLGGSSFTSAGALTVNGTLDANSTPISVGSLSGAGTLTNSGASTTITTAVSSPSVFSGTISDGGAGKTLSVVKNGTSSLTLSGPNSYSGSTTLNAGTLVAGSSTALGSGGALTISGGTLDLNGAGTSSSGPQSISVGSLSGTGGTITDNNSNAGTTTLNINQAVNGSSGAAINNGSTRAVALSKTGSSTLVLTNTASTYNGGTTISTGKLISPAPGTVGGGAVTLAGGTLSLGTMSGFGGSGSGWTINSVGSYITTPTPVTGDVLTLTDGGPNQARAAFFNAPQTFSNSNGNAFTANFTYTPSAGTNHADGIAFVIENDPRGSNIANGTGGNLGYGYGSAILPGTLNSGAVELNIYSTPTVGTYFGNNNGTGINNTSYPGSPGNPTTHYTTVTPVVLTSGDPINVSLAYNGTNLTEVLTDPTANTTSTTTFSNVGFQLNGTNGYVGFIGSNGGLTSVQTISNFSFENLAPQTWSNAVVASATMSSGVEVGVGNATVGPLTLQSGSTLNVTGASSLAANSAYSLTTGATTLGGPATVNVANNGTGTGTLALGAVGDGTNGYSLTKTGSGTLTLAAASSYSGNTNVNAGTLLVTNGSGSATGTGNVIVASTASLGGTGTISGSVTVNSGGTIFTGLSSSHTTAATLTVGPLTLNGSTMLNLTALPASTPGVGSADEIVSGGLLTFGGTLNVADPNTLTYASGDTFDLFGFGSETGTFSNVPIGTSVTPASLPTLTGGLTWNTSALYTSGIISIGTSGPNTLTWNNTGGTGDGTTWANGTTPTTLQNWQNAGSPSYYSDSPGDNVTFNDTNNSNYAVTINTVVTPGSTVVNTTGAYVFSGTGGIGGSGSLTKSGNGSLTLSTSDSYTGGTMVTGGTLNIESTSALPTASALSISSGASVVVDRNGNGRITLDLASLSNSGTINLENNWMIVHNQNQTDADNTTAAIFTQLQNGFAGGTWAGGTSPSIISSGPNGAAGSSLYTLGEMESGTDVLVKYAYYGDADLSGHVDGNDYSLIDTGFGSAGALTGWQNGDFNYDGHIDGSDYSLIDNAFNTQLGTAPAAQLALNTSEIAGGSAAVPEPASLGLLGIGAIGLMSRRRRKI